MRAGAAAANSPTVLAPADARWADTILIDRAGRVLARVRGERDWGSEAARGLVDALLER